MFGLFKRKKITHEPENLQRKELFNIPDPLRSLILGGESCDQLPNAYGEFGSLTNPIPVNGILGEIKYLGKLHSSPSGQGLFFHRIGSVKCSVTEHPVDKYETVCMDGTMWKDFYLDCYHPRRSNLAPSGYSIRPYFKELGMDVPFAFGVHEVVSNFPYGLPEAILNFYGDHPGKTFARHARELLAKANFERPSNASENNVENLAAEQEVHLCISCGRLINFLTIRCPHCDYIPNSQRDLAASIILSKRHLDIPQLIDISRRFNEGECFSDMVGNLEQKVDEMLVPNSEKSKEIEGMEIYIRQKQHVHYPSIPDLQFCENCGSQLYFFEPEESYDVCEKCGEEISLTPVEHAIRNLAHLLELIEERVDLNDLERLSKFICLTVYMLTLLIEKKGMDIKTKKRALSLLADIEIINTINRSSVIEIDNLTLHVIAENSSEESLALDAMLFAEFQEIVLWLKGEL
jgi:predicted RNA-binding Zn-ribbon protein involved in translation (DUF1610 family)